MTKKIFKSHKYVMHREAVGCDNEKLYLYTVHNRHNKRLCIVAFCQPASFDDIPVMDIRLFAYPNNGQLIHDFFIFMITDYADGSFKYASMDAYLLDDIPLLNNIGFTLIPDINGGDPYAFLSLTTHDIT